MSSFPRVPDPSQDELDADDGQEGNDFTQFPSLTELSNQSDFGTLDYAHILGANDYTTDFWNDTSAALAKELDEVFNQQEALFQQQQQQSQPQQQGPADTLQQQQQQQQSLAQIPGEHSSAAGVSFSDHDQAYDPWNLSGHGHLSNSDFTNPGFHNFQTDPTLPNLDFETGMRSSRHLGSESESSTLRVSPLHQQRPFPRSGDINNFASAPTGSPLHFIPVRDQHHGNVGVGIGTITATASSLGASSAGGSMGGGSFGANMPGAARVDQQTSSLSRTHHVQRKVHPPAIGNQSLPSTNTASVIGHGSASGLYLGYGDSSTASPQVTALSHMPQAGHTPTGQPAGVENIQPVRHQAGRNDLASFATGIPFPPSAGPTGSSPRASYTPHLGDQWKDSGGGDISPGDTARDGRAGTQIGLQSGVPGAGRESMLDRREMMSRAESRPHQGVPTADTVKVAVKVSSNSSSKSASSASAQNGTACGSTRLNDPSLEISAPRGQKRTRSPVRSPGHASSNDLTATQSGIARTGEEDGERIGRGTTEDAEMDERSGDNSNARARSHIPANGSMQVRGGRAPRTTPINSNASSTAADKAERKAKLKDRAREGQLLAPIDQAGDLDDEEMAINAPNPLEQGPMAEEAEDGAEEEQEEEDEDDAPPVKVARTGKTTIASRARDTSSTEGISKPGPSKAPKTSKGKVTGGKGGGTTKDSVADLGSPTQAQAQAQTTAKSKSSQGRLTTRARSVPPPAPALPMTETKKRASRAGSTRPPSGTSATAPAPGAAKTRPQARARADASGEGDGLGSTSASNEALTSTEQGTGHSPSTGTGAHVYTSALNNDPDASAKQGNTRGQGRGGSRASAAVRGRGGVAARTAGHAAREAPNANADSGDNDDALRQVIKSDVHDLASIEVERAKRAQNSKSTRDRNKVRSTVFVDHICGTVQRLAAAIQSVKAGMRERSPMLDSTGLQLQPAGMPYDSPSNMAVMSALPTADAPISVGSDQRFLTFLKREYAHMQTLQSNLQIADGLTRDGVDVSAYMRGILDGGKTTQKALGHLDRAFLKLFGDVEQEEEEGEGEDMEDGDGEDVEMDDANGHLGRSAQMEAREPMTGGVVDAHEVPEEGLKSLETSLEDSPGLASDHEQVIEHDIHAEAHDGWQGRSPIDSLSGAVLPETRQVIGIAQAVSLQMNPSIVHREMLTSSFDVPAAAPAHGRSLAEIWTPDDEAPLTDHDVAEDSAGRKRSDESAELARDPSVASPDTALASPAPLKETVQSFSPDTSITHAGQAAGQVNETVEEEADRNEIGTIEPTDTVPQPSVIPALSPIVEHNDSDDDDETHGEEQEGARDSSEQQVEHDNDSPPRLEQQMLVLPAEPTSSHKPALVSEASNTRSKSPPQQPGLEASQGRTFSDGGLRDIPPIIARSPSPTLLPAAPMPPLRHRSRAWRDNVHSQATIAAKTAHARTLAQSSPWTPRSAFAVAPASALGPDAQSPTAGSSVLPAPDGAMPAPMMRSGAETDRQRHQDTGSHGSSSLGRLTGAVQK